MMIDAFIIYCANISAVTAAWTADVIVIILRIYGLRDHNSRLRASALCI